MSTSCSLIGRVEDNGQLYLTEDERIELEDRVRNGQWEPSLHEAASKGVSAVYIPNKNDVEYNNCRTYDNESERLLKDLIFKEALQIRRAQILQEHEEIIPSMLLNSPTQGDHGNNSIMSISNTPISDPIANQTGDEVSNGSNNIPFPAISNEKHSGVVNNGNVNSTSLMMSSETLESAAVQGNNNYNNNNNNNNNQ